MNPNLALEFVRVTEAAAIAAADWLGKGDKKAADKAAVDAMRSHFNTLNFNGEVVVGEGEKDEAPMLYSGEKIGTGRGEAVDIAVDPLEGTELVAKGRQNAISVLAAGTKGSLLKTPGSYMDQIAVGREARGAVDITKPLRENVKIVAAALNKNVKDVTVVLLERDRHKIIIDELRKIGCRVFLIEHGTVAAGLATAIEGSGIDMMIGVGGAPEGVITAAGLKCLGGDFQGVLKPHEAKYVAQAHAMGIDNLDHVFGIDELAKGDELQFVATGVSSGSFLQGVMFHGKNLTTHSIVMQKKSGTVRFLKTVHKNEGEN
ncbi:class II fructose-bisphosphatase [Candidatus Woesearchaeota archaeon]|nr:class II fructose-bisphosphatase [Candidatus Woesearchaeota archaeon]